MLKEDYINKKAKTIHYAYIYYKNGTPLCFVVDNDSMCRLTKGYNGPNTDETDKIIRNIKNDIGVHINNYRKFKRYCKEYKEGEFNFKFEELASLKGCPKVITGNFNCAGNKLTSLEDGPEEVDGYFNCSYNNITSLKGCPKKVGGYFDCSGNKLKTLKGCPKVITGSFDCAGNELTSLKSGPKVVKGNFNCFNNGISKEELLRYLKTADISDTIYTNFGRFVSKKEAIERLSGTYFDY